MRRTVVKPVIGASLGPARFCLEAMNRRTITAVIVVVAIAAIAGLLYLINTPDREAVITGPERAEDARALIADLDEGDAPDYDTAFGQAQQFHGDGRLADAQLLYFYAARGGHAPSEFALAQMNDPNHHSAETSLLGEPDPFQAYKWYSAALEHGQSSAAMRLEELRAWAEEAAAAGDPEAEQLLLQWQSR